MYSIAHINIYMFSEKIQCSPFTDAYAGQGPNTTTADRAHRSLGHLRACRPSPGDVASGAVATTLFLVKFSVKVPIFTMSHHPLIENR